MPINNSLTEQESTRQDLLALVEEIRRNSNELRNLRAADAQTIKTLRAENARLRAVLASHGIVVEP